MLILIGALSMLLVCSLLLVWRLVAVIHSYRDGVVRLEHIILRQHEAIEHLESENERVVKAANQVAFAPAAFGASDQTIGLQ